MAVFRNEQVLFARRELSWLARYSVRRRILSPRLYERAKRGIDLLVCTLLLPLLLPIFLLCVLAITLESPGASPLFAQQRTGRHGRRFRMYKFRTMVPNAEAMKQQLLHLNELQLPDFKITNDPRITRVGRILRKTSLDELPQLINVFSGEMSLVGPRPTSFAASTYRLWQTRRLSVTPGLTGLWQVYGRAQTEFDERLRLDIAYIERRCLALDLELLLRTVSAVIAARGAH
jgi:lipopolysaccharide/colanic/teichoic acid biosynthesis glycosyltransferase